MENIKMGLSTCETVWEQAKAVASLGKLENCGHFILLSQWRLQEKAKWYNFPPVLIYYLSTSRDECKLQNVFTQIHFHIWTSNIYLFLNKWRLGMKENIMQWTPLPKKESWYFGRKRDQHCPSKFHIWYIQNFQQATQTFKLSIL